MDWTGLDCLPSDCLWLRPLGLVCGRAAAEAIASGHAHSLGANSCAFTLIAAIGLGPDRCPVSVTAPTAEFEAWIASAGARFAGRAREQLASLSAPRGTWAGLALDRPLIMAVLNVTPDSFSD